MKEEDFFHGERKKQRHARKMATKRDRSKHKKTDREKRRRRLEEEAEKKLEKKDLLRGRILEITPEAITVDCEGEQILCTLSGLLKKERSEVKNLVTVGDFVLFEPKKCAIAHVEIRHSVLSRKEHLRRREQQLIAANIDQVLITVSVADPPLKPPLVDRYIIATLKGGMEPVIVINKIDLLQGSISAFKKTYRALGIPVIELSAERGTGLEKLKRQMKGKASVFSGQSGVGKSSLINALTGSTLVTQEVVRKTRKGAHTTTSAKLIPLDFGGWCIDTPGIRSFGLWDLQREDLVSYFPEITDIARLCRYPNCSHTHEPSCAVLEALESRKLSPIRFDSYLKLLSELKGE